METLYKLLAGGFLTSPFVAYLTFKFKKSIDRDEYRKQRISSWNLMVNQVHDVYPTGHFLNWDQYPSLEVFLSKDQKVKVASLKLGDLQTARISNRHLGTQDSEFMSVVRMLKAEISRIEKDIWKLI